jgi:hypothetical protein
MTAPAVCANIKLNKNFVHVIHSIKFSWILERVGHCTSIYCMSPCTINIKTPFILRQTGCWVACRTVRLVPYGRVLPFTQKRKLVSRYIHTWGLSSLELAFLLLQFLHEITIPLYAISVGFAVEEASLNKPRINQSTFQDARLQLPYMKGFTLHVLHVLTLSNRYICILHSDATTFNYFHFKHCFL